MNYEAKETKQCEWITKRKSTRKKQRLCWRMFDGMCFLSVFVSIKSKRVSCTHGLGMSPSAWANGTGCDWCRARSKLRGFFRVAFVFLFVFCLQNIRWLLMICLDVFPDIWPDLACICSSFRGVPAGLDIMHKLYGVLRSSDFVLLGANTKMVVWGETFISRWESDRKSKVTRCRSNVRKNI
jgi:hypothetical protein